MSITLIDGGLSTELEDMGRGVSESKLWTAQWLIDDPDVLKQAHINFIKNGSKIIETCSYQLSVENLIELKQLSSDQAKELIKKSVETAKQARLELNAENVRIAGSIGPLGACRCDGSEFSGTYSDNMTIEYLKEWHRPRLECLKDCDLLACETIPSIKEATAIIELIAEYPNLKAWLSFSCKDGTSLCNGDSFNDAFKKFRDNKQLIAIGINCTSPYHIVSLLESVERVPNDLPFIVYSNDGKIWDAVTKTFKGADDQIEVVYNLLPAWFKLGVKFIGGCCNIGSKDLKKFNEIIEKYEKNLE